MDTDVKSSPVIDCDLHNTVPSVEALLPYLPRYWREYITQSSFKGPIDDPYPAAASTSFRPEFRMANGLPAAVDLDHLRRHALDPWHTEIGILNCAYGVESLHNPDAAAALASAVNDWQAVEWLAPEPRLRAALVVPSHYPELAAREIDRLGDHPGFVQVYLPVRSAEPYGNRRYHPIFAAALRHDLAVGIHFGGAPGTPPTPSGWPSYYIEEYAGMAQVFQSHVLSLIAEGVFEQFPELRVVLIEGGFTWLPSLMWRLDRAWERLWAEVPHVAQPPSQTIREHFWMTTQPIEEPSRPAYFHQLLDQLDMPGRLMFSTDYPHWDFDAPDRAVPPGLSPDLKAKIMAGNARALYGLPAPVPHD